MPRISRESGLKKPFTSCIPTQVTTRAGRGNPRNPALEFLDEINRRLKHCHGIRDRLRQECRLQDSALQTAKIDELTELGEWVKMLPSA